MGWFKRNLGLAGVISEGRFETDTIMAERADCLRADGTIRI